MARKKVKTIAEIRKELDHVLESSAGSDLAFVLIATAYIEQSLGAMLLDFFIEESSESMLTDPRLGGSLSGRTQLCYCLGFIPKSVKQNIDLIASIRNDFAHSHSAIGFSTQYIKEKTSRLKLLSAYYNKEPHPQGWDPRERFKVSCAVTIGLLLAIQSDIKRIKPLHATNLT